MIYNRLGNSDLKVSRICLGTMTFGEQNTKAEAFEQMDYAFEQGVDFFDTAEMYSVPGNKDTVGSTEKIIGEWLKDRGLRNKITLASKVVGPGVQYIRGGSNFSQKNIREAVEGSLQKLQTDYLDLYQLHWPERENNRFGRRLYPYQANEEYQENFLESVLTLKALIQEGKIKHWGLSNETPWGVMKYLAYCKENDAPQPISIQNAYGLLNRQYEYGLSEITQFEGIGLLAYSPLAFGALSGKYLNGARPEGARLSKYGIFKRFLNPRAMQATAEFKKIADQNNLTVAELGHAFVLHQPFLHSCIIGATKMEQLKENIAAINITLSNETLKEIHKVFEKYPDSAL